jgi:hypothetical protein
MSFETLPPFFLMEGNTKYLLSTCEATHSTAHLPNGRGIMCVQLLYILEEHIERVLVFQETRAI